jgi:predicted NodU family carbamoyl transferase
MEKRFLVERYDDGSFHVIGCSYWPKSAEYKVHGLAPDPRMEILDIIDDTNEQGEVIGKKAVVNQAKLAQYEADRAAEEQARQDEAAQRAAKVQALKDSVSGFNSMTAAQKWNVVKSLLEHIVGE